MTSCHSACHHPVTTPVTTLSPPELSFSQVSSRVQVARTLVRDQDCFGRVCRSFDRPLQENDGTGAGKIFASRLNVDLWIMRRALSASFLLNLFCIPGAQRWPKRQNYLFFPTDDLQNLLLPQFPRYNFWLCHLFLFSVSQIQRQLSEFSSIITFNLHSHRSPRILRRQHGRLVHSLPLSDSSRKQAACIRQRRRTGNPRTFESASEWVSGWFSVDILCRRIPIDKRFSWIQCWHWLCEIIDHSSSTVSRPI